MHDEEIEVDEALVRHLIDTQFPELADRPLATVGPWGTDNAIWRLGVDLVVRLPRIHWATGQVEREATWLPRIAPYLPIAVPRPVAIGEPGVGIPTGGPCTGGFPATVPRWRTWTILAASPAASPVS